MRTALTHPVQTPRNVHFSFAGAAQTAFGVVANDVGNRPADADQAVGVVEQLQIPPVPRHQFQRLVDHADALGDVLDRALQQRAVELQHFRGFVSDSDYVLQLHFPTFDGGLYYGARRRSAEDTSQQAFGVGNPFAVGVLVGVEALALAVGEANEALSRAFFADKTRRQLQQIVDLYRQHRTSIRSCADFLADETPSLPVLGNPRAREHRDPGEQGEITGQRQHYALSQRGDRQVQWIAVQPRQPGETRQRPAETVRGNRQY